MISLVAVGNWICTAFALGLHVVIRSTMPPARFRRAIDPRLRRPICTAPIRQIQNFTEAAPCPSMPN